MKNLIAKIRLEVFRKNLEHVKKLSESVRSRRQHVERLDDLLKKAALLSDDLGRGLRAGADLVASKRLRDLPDETIPQLKGSVEYTKLMVEELTKLVQGAADIAMKMRERLAPLAATFDRAVLDDINDKTCEWVCALNAAEVVLRESKPDALAAAAEWRATAGKVYDTSQPIFSEYVNFLGGLALRDTGFDENVCRIADELIKDCGQLGYTEWKSLTIPSWQGALTLARIIRMGFPEWTIWALPLTAHELGQVIMTDRNIRRINTYLTQEVNLLGDDVAAQRDDPISDEERKVLTGRVQVCLSDAFAAYAMGPAYACALLLLRLNPIAAPDKEGMLPADAERAHITLHMLQLMSGQGFAQNHYQNVIDLLRDEWDLALKHSNEAEAALDPEVADRLEKWATFLWEYLMEDPIGMYKAEHWTTTKTALESLVTADASTKWYSTEEGRGELEKNPDNRNAMREIQLDGAEKWRDVLNAAWEYRVKRLDEGNPAQPELIAEAAQRLWEFIGQKNKEKSQISSPAYSSGQRAAGLPSNITGDKF